MTETNNTDDELPRFERGQRIELRGNEYGVESVDKVWAEDKVIQYRLDPTDGAPPAHLKPEQDGGIFVIHEFHEVDPDDVVVNDDE